MLRMNELIFDDVVEGTTAVYTDAKFYEAMGTPDVFYLAYIATQAGGTSPTLTLTAQMSADGITWGQWGSVITSAATLTAGQKNVGGSSDYTTNGFRNMRVKIELGGSGPSTRLQLWWMGRDFAK